jgi:starvation-inducible DNA-binding protein
MKVDTGIEDKGRKEVAESLAKLLADTYSLYLKTQGFHWNVTGMNFEQLHLMFERQYKDLADAVDRLAERIRALGFMAPASYSQFARLTSVPEETGVPGDKEMIKALVHGHEEVVKTARRAATIAQEFLDEVSVNLLSDRMETHEKTAWMLRSLVS